MNNSFVSYNPYANPYLDNSLMQEISYPNFSGHNKAGNGRATVSNVVKESSSDITKSEYDRLQQYIEKEIDKGQKDLLVA